MTKETTYSGIIGEWQRLGAALSANPELAHLEVTRAKLTALTERALEITKQQAALAAAKQAMSQEIREVAAQGERAARALRVNLKEHFGPRSEKLTEFGIRPFRGRKVKTEEPLKSPPAHATPAAPTPSAD